MARRRSVTIFDVAAEVGVHASTVSRALNQPERVSAATVARVHEVVERLGFVPNRAARGLITGRTGILAVIVPDITNPYFSALLRAAEHAAREREHQLLLVDTGERPESEVSGAQAISSQVDGFIVVSPRRLHLELDALGGAPTVFVNRPVAGHRSIILRSARAAADALEHLAGMGHARVAFAGGPARSWAARERRDALRRASRRLGVELLELGPAEPTFDAGRTAGAQALDLRATAVFAYNDLVALGALASLRDLGVSVPDDMSVVGCDDVPLAAMVSPALTTIHMPTAEAGRAAVEGLVDDTGATELEGHLVVRASTGRAPRRRAGRPVTRRHG